LQCLQSALLQDTQKIQQACAGIVYKIYPTLANAINLKWLLVDERIDFTISKIFFKGLLDEKTPDYLHLHTQERTRHLRNSENDATIIYKNQPKAQSTFLDYAGKVYNEIPKTIKETSSLSAKNE